MGTKQTKWHGTDSTTKQRAVTDSPSRTLEIKSDKRKEGIFVTRWCRSNERVNEILNLLVEALYPIVVISKIGEIERSAVYRHLVDGVDERMQETKNLRHLTDERLLKESMYRFLAGRSPVSEVRMADRLINRPELLMMRRERGLQFP